MFIRAVDEGLERLLRATLPLPEDVGDIAFDPPTAGWSATLSRLTVDLFLYDVGRSSRVVQAPVRRVSEDGRNERRAPQPMIQLGYLVSAWAGSPRDEHQLLGDVLNRLAPMSELPSEYVPGTMNSRISLTVGDDENNRLRDIWSAAGGQLKASFTMQVIVAADAVDWIEEAPSVTSVAGSAVPRPRS